MGTDQLTMAQAPAGQRVNEHVTALPAAGLRPLIVGYSGYRQAGLAPARHRGMPSPYLTVIFTLDEPLTVAGHPDPRQPGGRYETLAGGLHTSPALITHDGWQSGIQVALSPLGARAILGVPAGELASLDVEGTDLLGPLARQIQERVRAGATWPERFAVLDELLGSRACDSVAGACGGLCDWCLRQGGRGGRRRGLGLRRAGGEPGGRVRLAAAAAHRRPGRHLPAGGRDGMERPAPARPVPGRNRADAQGCRPGYPF